jgi:hypothetical protein
MLSVSNTPENGIRNETGNGTRVAVMQPYFFPYIGYFQLINSVDKFVFFDDVNFIKRGFVNRNTIITNGEKSLISLPVKKASINRKINEHVVDLENKSFTKLFKQVKASYPASPYISELVDYFIAESKKTDNLSLLLESSIMKICRDVGIQTQFFKSSQIGFSELNGEERILNIVKELHGDTYFNPEGGQGLYSRETFANENISLKYIKKNFFTEYNKYPQKTKGEFYDNLSILDIIGNDYDHIESYLYEFTVL